MAGTYKVVLFVLVLAISVSMLVTGERAQRRAERSLAGQYSQSEADAELASELQWLREKTAQVA